MLVERKFVEEAWPQSRMLFYNEPGFHTASPFPDLVLEQYFPPADNGLAEEKTYISIYRLPAD